MVETAGRFSPNDLSDGLVLALLMSGFTFAAFASPTPERRRESAILTGILTKIDTSSTVKAVVNLVLNAVNAAIVAAVVADGSAIFSEEVIITTLIGMAISVASYLGFYKPVELNQKLVPEKGI